MSPSASNSPPARVESALTTIVRCATLPRLNGLIAANAGVAVERSVYTILAAIDAGERARLSDLANQLGVDASTISRQVKEVERLGYVTRSSQARDRRASALRLTADGRRALALVRRARRRTMSDLLAELSTEKQVALADLLDHLAARISSYAREDKTADVVSEDVA